MIPARRGILARAIFLFTARDNSQRIVGQWSLQFERLRRVGQKPQIDLCRRCQNDRHRLRMDWGDDRIRFCREESRTTHADHQLARSSALERRAKGSIDQQTRTTVGPG